MVDLPTPVSSSVLQIGPVELRVHVLDDGQRVIEAESVEEFFNWLAGTTDFTEEDAVKVAEFVSGHKP